MILALNSSHVIRAPSQDDMNHAEPYEGARTSGHGEIVAQVELLSSIFSPPKPNSHDEERQAAEQPMDKKCGIHGYVGVVVNILFRRLAIKTICLSERLWEYKYCKDPSE